MKAVQYREIGKAPEVVTVPDPEAGPGQVVLEVAAAGVCHSDIAVMEWPAEVYNYGFPLTLGHEGVGKVAALGQGVTGLEVGEMVAVYGPQGCGSCAKCAEGKENYCLRAAELGINPPGLGAPGAMAEYMLIDNARHLVPLGDLDPISAAPLTDAGLTPYHAIKKSLPKLVPGSTAVVIGTGGLGHMAIQILRATTAARVIALDVSKEKLELAAAVGAHETVLSDANATKAVRELTGGLGAEVVLDFVGVGPTVATAAGVVAVEGDLTVVGIGGGTVPVGFGTIPFDVSVSTPYWGSRGELIEVLDLARSGALTVHTETFGIDEAPLAYERLHAGQVRGRAVVLPRG
ncbi:NAD(P)-dependent alcohol dehydrogenase [Actinosynnema pretiosum]|uniref:alcohol dehydrogenase n=1 Tax=Actinosynnema pretiosum TaxID=42197 RepID=A0A290Z6I5_9PSEU|nr:NAD(P)-dependent alcohol dehydrogenase [Actinosynnema pretiosum]ATE54608.1 alcohol dehydrogenase [Actinosynnema pretiosum]